jgi:hypothetical protein
MMSDASLELRRAPEAVTFSASDLETLRNVIAVGIPDPELRLFAKVCGQLALSPFRGEVVVVPRRTNIAKAGQPASWVTIWRHQITIVGRRVLAERTGEVEGIVGPEWCGPHTPEPDSPLQWVDVWLAEQPPHAARVTVYRRGRRPYVGTTPWREFAVTDSKGALMGLWPTMPAHMLGKTAEALALGRAFPEIRETLSAAGVEWQDAPRDETAEPTPSAGSVEPGAEEADQGRGVPSPRPAHNPNEHIVPSDEQLRTVRAALARAGYTLDADQRVYIADLLNRDTVTWGELSRYDLEDVQARLGGAS